VNRQVIPDQEERNGEHNIKHDAAPLIIDPVIFLAPDVRQDNHDHVGRQVADRRAKVAEPRYQQHIHQDRDSCTRQADVSPEARHVVQLVPDREVKRDPKQQIG